MDEHTGALLRTVVPSSCDKGDRMNWKSLVLACAILLAGTGWAEAQCIVDTSTPTYENGKFLRYVPCDATGAQKTTGAGGGGAGDASAANQVTTHGYIDGLETLITSTNTKLDTVDGRVDGLETLITSTNTKLDTVITSVQTLDNMITGSRGLVQLVDSAGNEIVVPTAGNTHYDAADASTNSTNVEASSGTIFGISLSSTATTVYYLRLYNLASAPTCSSATGFVESIPIPPAAAAGQVGGREIQYNIGKAFSTGISYCITASSSSTANDNAAAGVFVSILWKP